MIKAIADLGAEDGFSYCYGEDPQKLYFIDHNHAVKCAPLDSALGRIIMEYYREIQLPEQWLDGELLVGRGGNLFAVFSHKEKDSSFVAYMQASEDSVQEYPDGVICNRENYRLATDEEAKKFHELLHKHGKGWDAEKKKLVNWKWKLRKYETYWVATGLGGVKSLMWYGDMVDKAYYDLGNCFPTREEAEALAEKFKKLFKGD